MVPASGTTTDGATRLAGDRRDMDRRNFRVRLVKSIDNLLVFSWTASSVLSDGTDWERGL